MTSAIASIVRLSSLRDVGEARAGELVLDRAKVVEPRFAISYLTFAAGALQPS